MQLLRELEGFIELQASEVKHLKHLSVGVLLDKTLQEFTVRGGQLIHAAQDGLHLLRVCYHWTRARLNTFSQSSITISSTRTSST